MGQGACEEIDYEPAGRGGRNYGWRNREGAIDPGIIPALPPAFLPLTEPIFDYPRSSGQAVTGGFVYRGAALGATYRGRYFFADFVAARVWSIALTIAPGSGEATASNLVEHTAELGGSGTIGGIASFGVDASGELYLASFNGSIRRILPGIQVPNPLMNIDLPANNAVVQQPFVMAGWALDANAPTGTGITTLHVWAFPASGAAARFVGVASFQPRPDVGGVFGQQFTPSGFGLQISGLPPGAYQLMAFAWVAASNAFTLVRIGQRHDRIEHAPLHRSAQEPGRGFESVPIVRMDVRQQRGDRHGGRHDPRLGVSTRRRHTELRRRADLRIPTAGCRSVLRHPIHAERLQHGHREPEPRPLQHRRLLAQRRHELVRRGPGGQRRGAIDAQETAARTVL